MTWPPAALPIDFENATPQENTHPDAHNTTNQTINADLVPEINRVGALADTIGLYLPLTGGTLTGDLQVNGQVRTGNGAEGGPAFSFTNYPTTGMYGHPEGVFFAVDGQWKFGAWADRVGIRHDLQVDGQTKAQNGTKTAPAYSFALDPDTGFYRVGANSLGFTTGGERRAYVNSQGLYMYVPVLAQDGTKTAPAYSFSADPDTGFYRPAANVIEVVANGKRLLQMGIDAGSTETGAWMPTINTRTATSPANVYLSPSASDEGALFRSTASRAFMQEIETVNLDATNSVYDLAPIWFRSKCDGDNLEHSHYGLAAEDCAAVDPRLAIMATDENGVETADNVNTNAVIALLVAAVQEQRATISDLTARVEALENA
jgi:hypothetical protein